MTHIGTTTWVIPEGYLIVSDVPVVVQHTRLDSRDPAIALMSTLAYHV